ncbi:hypothetical protein KP509_29G019100 [Ceratopteris richardii]|uniref:Mitochondrial carrier protein n=1 Tax=Ceratopteris richardii TaxID=49495 RepID=A0A8T2R569_CERRI|nr:hypothetical protein KP509_29G019100 [Ceratopteris richardii]
MAVPPSTTESEAAGAAAGNISSEERKTLNRRMRGVGRSFLVGGISGATSTVLFQPFDVVKTHIQGSQTFPPPKIRDSIRLIVGRQGISGLWAGTTPAVVRVGLGAGLYFSMLNPILAFLSAGDLTASSSTTENLQKRLPHSVVLAAGAITRSAAAAIVCPVTVLKTRMEYEAVSGVHYPNPLRSLALIGRTEGLKGLYSGLLPTILRDAPYSGLYLLLYSSTRRAISEWQNLSGAHMQVNFIAGAVAGASATVLTHPPDVVRTKLQLESGQHSGIISSVRHVYQCNGIRGFFAGIVPRAGRRALHQAISCL